MAGVAPGRLAGGRGPFLPSCAQSLSPFSFLVPFNPLTSSPPPHGVFPKKEANCRSKCMATVRKSVNSKCIGNRFYLKACSDCSPPGKSRRRLGGAVRWRRLSQHPKWGIALPRFKRNSSSALSSHGQTQPPPLHGVISAFQASDTGNQLVCIRVILMETASSSFVLGASASPE